MSPNIKKKNELGVWEDATIPGPRGPTGPQGEKGDTGEQGPPGQDGSNGLDGRIGPTGQKGDKGLKGDKGDTGEQGPPGDDGDPGQKGDKGDPGIGIPKGGRTGQVLEKVSPKDFDTKWNYPNYGSSGGGGGGGGGPQGPKGDQGDKGDKGLTGDKGDKGLTGDKGEKGDQGIQGLTGAPGEPTTVTDSASINFTLAAHDLTGVVVPAGLDKYVQFNDAGILGGDANFTYDKATDTLNATYFTGDGSGLTGVGATTETNLTITVKAKVQIRKGQAVYITPGVAAAPDVDLCDNTDSTKSRILGIAVADITASANGAVRRGGVLTNIDTRRSSAGGTGYVNTDEVWTEGNLLFASTGGHLTNVRPTSGRSVKVGYTVKGNSTTDSIVVFPMENPVWSTAAVGENIVLRTGDAIGTNKVSIRDYANVEVGYVDSDGNADFAGNVNIATGKKIKINSIDLAASDVGAATTANKIDDFAVCGTSDTTKDANTTNHGLLLKAVAPVTGFVRYVGIAYGETIYALKELFAATTPSMDGVAAAGTALTAARIDHIHPVDTSRAATGQKLDDFGTPDDNTDLNANSTNHGLLLKATVPAATLLNVVGITNGETAYTNKALYDATNPAALGAVSPGTSLSAARRDHVHANPAIDTLAAATDITTLDASTTAHGLAAKVVSPGVAGLCNFLGVAGVDTSYSNKPLFDTTVPVMDGVAAAGIAMLAARRDHVHPVDTSRAATGQKLDDFGTPDDNTDLNANTTNHGLLLKATAPAAGLRSVVAIDNAETAYTNKALFDATVPVMDSVAAAGTAMVAARRDHVHPSDNSKTSFLALGAVDLDTCITTGYFTITNAGAGSHWPTVGLGVGAYAHLTVFTAGADITQLFYGSGFYSQRISSNTGASWTAWSNYLYPFEAVTVPLINGVASVGSLKTVSLSDHIHPVDTSRSPVANPTFTGVPAAPTAAQEVNTTQIATTAFVIGQQTRNNFIINGNFDIWQRGSSFTSATVPINSDDTYLADNWVLLSDGNNIVSVTQSSVNVPVGSPWTLLATVVTANKKFGFITFLENKDAKKLAGKNVSLSFQACTTAAKVINKVRAAVISWSSTADAITSDVVNAWGAQGTNPTVVANWTLENVAADLTLTNAMQTFKIENIAVDTASMANLAVFIWVDDTDCAVGDLLYLSQVKLEINPVATSYQPPAYLDELLKCQRYMVKFNPLGNTYPAIAIGQCRSTTLARCIATLPVDMFAVPASTQKGNLAVTQASATVQAVTNLALVAAMCTPRQIWWEATVAANLVAGNATVLEGNNDVTADIWLEAVL